MGEKYWLYLLIACLVVLLITSIIALANSPKYRAKIGSFIIHVIKPFLKKSIIELITQIEVAMQDEQVEKAGVEKMKYVINKIIEKIPEPFNHYITHEQVNKLCQNVYDKIQDKLPILVEQFRKEINDK